MKTSASKPAARRASKSAEPPGVSALIPGPKLVEMYRMMVRLRKFEERCYQIYLQRRIGGFCHLYTGQEAVAVGMIMQLEPQDYVITAYRDHGHALARGVSAQSCMAELYGRATGCSRGKGGSMHFFDTSINFMGGHGIVGAHVPLACGLGWASRHQKKNAVCLCFFGDGAMNQGAVHEALNLATLYKLPVVFICENNGYAMGTAVARGAAEENIYLRANSYKMPTCRVDGNNLYDVYKTTAEAINRARREFQPTFIEAVTYRYRGHSMSDPGSYRTREEIEEHKARDTIFKISRDIVETRAATREQIDAIDAEEAAGVEAAVKFAEESPECDPHTAFEDIYLTYPADVRKSR